MPVRRLADRIGGEATSSSQTQGANYSNPHSIHVMPQMPSQPMQTMTQMPMQQMPIQYLPVHTADMQYYAHQVGGPMSIPTESVPGYVAGHASLGAEYMPAEMMMGGGYVPCDVLPRKAATIHDIWSGSNFCEEVAEMLQAHGNSKYFSQGVGEPTMHQINRGGLRERDMAKAGVGIALQRDDHSGIINVKRIALDGSAAADGRLCVMDIILAVDGIATASIGQEVTSLIIGPEGTFVELVVEHVNGQQETIRIRRGAPQPQDDAPNLPYQSYKTYDELPYYLSANDKEAARSEVSSRISEMRKRILSKPDVPCSTILAMDLVDHGASAGANYGVSQRPFEAPSLAQGHTSPAPTTSPGVTATSSPRVLASGPGTSISQQTSSPAPAVQEEPPTAGTSASSKKKKKR